MRTFLGLCLIGFGVFLLSARGQTTQPEIAARLTDKPLFLRGRWTESKLKFSIEGTPEKQYKTSSWTVTGFDVRSVVLKNGVLRIHGRRIGTDFHQQGVLSRVVLNDMSVEVEGLPGADFSKALDAVFVPDFDTLRPDLPFYWNDLAARNFRPEPPPKKGEKVMRPTAEGILHVGGNVLPPKLLAMSEAVFSPEAKDRRYSGDVLVSLVVSTDGLVDASSLRIVRAVGLGLDEQALAAAMRYKFSPATRDGVPVKVVISIDVTFQVF